MKIIAIIQARMGSSRLPAKVLTDLRGKPVLQRVVSRAKRAQLLDQVVVATTHSPRDDAIIDVCRVHGWDHFRGDEYDVLDRYYRAASHFKADVIVRITSDCPLIEPEIVDRVVDGYLEEHNQIDYASNVFPFRSFPRGLDVEAVSKDALRRAWQQDRNPVWREHVTLYIQRNPDLFKTKNVTNPVDHSSMRWTVDTLEDLTFLRRIFDSFHHDDFGWEDVLSLLKKHPEWLKINEHVQQVIVE